MAEYLDITIKLRKVAKEKKLSFAAIAKALNLPLYRISHVMTGATRRFDYIKQVADFLKVKLYTPESEEINIESYCMVGKAIIEALRISKIDISFYKSQYLIDKVYRFYLWYFDLQTKNSSLTKMNSNIIFVYTLAIIQNNPDFT